MGAHCGRSEAAAVPNPGSDKSGLDLLRSLENAPLEKAVISSGLDLGKVPAAEKRVRQTGSSKQPDSCFYAVGFTCRKGRRATCRYPNQDAWAVHRTPGQLSAYGVFDGHGEQGHLVSDFVKERLMQQLLEDRRSCRDEAAELARDAFRRVQRDVASRQHLRAEDSGTTATVVVHSHRHGSLTVSHVGDSTAVLLKRRTGDPGGLEAVTLTRDHKPQLEDERRRIESSGGRVTFDGFSHRVAKRVGVLPGLAMSRSLGDGAAHKLCGVIAEPEVSEHVVGSEDHAVLVCSDGIWDVITPQEAADMVAEFAECQSMAAARKLAKEALGRWLEATGGQTADDITVVLAFLQPEAQQLQRVTTPSTMPPSLQSGLSRCTASESCFSGSDAL